MTDASDPDAPTIPFADLPMQPTGSGVADLAVAVERMTVEEGETGVADAGDERAESAAHPS